MKKNNLDEMQDRKLLKLEEYGFWIMFWGLAAAIVIQLVTGAAIREVAGELIVLALGSVFIAAGTLKNGLWTRSSTPTVKGNAAAALLPAFLIAVIHVIRMAKTGSFSRDNILKQITFQLRFRLRFFLIRRGKQGIMNQTLRSLFVGDVPKIAKKPTTTIGKLFVGD